MEEFNVVCNILCARLAAKHGRKLAKIPSHYFMAALVVPGINYLIVRQGPNPHIHEVMDHLSFHFIAIAYEA
jgi:hypothetical protein